jgi:hypothetical protein
MEISNRRDIAVLSNTLNRFNGTKPWGLLLTAVPEGQTVDDMGDATEYLQAGGSADAMTLQIRKPGGQTWGCEWVRYTVGRATKWPDSGWCGEILADVGPEPRRRNDGHFGHGC